MTVDMDEALGQWLKQVSKAAELSISEQEKITKAGADVYAKKLAETTKEKHPNTKGDGGKYGHLSEDISSAAGDIDGDHFVDNARDDAKDAVFAAEAEKYQAMIAKANGGGDK